MRRTKRAYDKATHSTRIASTKRRRGALETPKAVMTRASAGYTATKRKDKARALQARLRLSAKPT
jgi:hypothetical protein